MKRQLGKVDQRGCPWAGFREHVLDRLLRIILVQHTMFVMVVRGSFEMQFGMHHLESPLMVERDHLPGRCSGLTEEGEQEDDCEQPAHEVGALRLVCA